MVCLYVFASCSLDTRFSFSSQHLFQLELSAMAALQKSVNSSLLGALAASCLLIALWVQGGEAVPIGSHCRLANSDFEQPYITNRTFMLAGEVLISVSISLSHLLYLEPDNSYSNFLQSVTEIFKNPSSSLAGRPEDYFSMPL